jgi:NADH-quinone oxidoreductase subunit H
MVAESVLLLVILLIVIAYVLYADRKIWAAVQLRRGPNVVGPWGLFQSFADLLKFVLKEPVIPAGANKGVFLLAPLVTCVLGACRLGRDSGQRRLGDRQHQCRHPLHLRDLLARRLRHHHGRLGVEFEISVPRGAALGGADGVLRGLDRLRHHHGAALRRLAQPHRHRRGAEQRRWGLLGWYWLPLFPMFVIFFVSALAETNRPPFDLVEAESELVAGFMVEYGSTPYMMFMLGEYVAIATMCAMATILFLGGWLPPFPVAPFTWIPGVVWFVLKASFVFFMFAMVKAFVPRYRYDQLMRLGWKVFLPISLAMVVIVAGVADSKSSEG